MCTANASSLPLRFKLDIMMLFVCQVFCRYTIRFNTALCKVYKFQRIIIGEIFLDILRRIQYTCINTFFEHNILWLPYRTQLNIYLRVKPYVYFIGGIENDYENSEA